MKIDLVAITGLVLHFRTPEKTIACLRSQYGEGIDKIVVVDNSEDDGRSVLVMEDELKGLRNAGLDTVILEPGYNLGFAGGVAFGLEYITAKSPSHVLLINSDAQLTKGSLELMRHALDNADIVAPMIAQYGDQPPTSPYAYYDRLLSLITPYPIVTPIKHASGCCLLIHYTQARSVLFNKDFFFYGEDALFGFDAKQRGITVSECKGAVVTHATSTSAKNGSIFYEYHMARAHWLLASRLAHNRLEFLFFIAARVFMLPLRASVRTFRFHSLVAWKGLLIATVDVLRGRCRSFTPPP